MDAIYPERMGGKVTIQFRDGTSQNRCVEIPRGGPENFPAPDLHQSKVRSLVEPEQGGATVGLHARLISFAHADTVDTLFG